MKHIQHCTKLMDCKLFVAYLDRDTDKTYFQRKRLPAQADVTAKEWATVIKRFFCKTPANAIPRAVRVMMNRHHWPLNCAINSLKKHAGVSRIIDINVK